MGHMCNVNMCVTFCKKLCFVGSWKTSFIIASGVGMEFNVCYNIKSRWTLVIIHNYCICFKSIVFL